MALVDHSPRSASVRARIDTRLMALTRTAFYSLVRTESVLASKLLWSFVQVLSHRLRATNEALSGLNIDLDTTSPPFAKMEQIKTAIRSASEPGGNSDSGSEK